MRQPGIDTGSMMHFRETTLRLPWLTPKKTKAIGEAKIKTDKIDSHMLAYLLPESYLAPLETRELRELLRHRIFLVRERAKVKSKIRNLLSKLNLSCPSKDVHGKEALEWLNDHKEGMPQIFSDKLEDFLKLGEDLTTIVDGVEEKIDLEATGDKVVQLLITIPGVGQFTALLIKAEVGTIDRFPDGDHLASYWVVQHKLCPLPYPGEAVGVSSLDSVCFWCCSSFFFGP